MAAFFAAALREVVECLERLGIPFLVGGSMASVVHGEIRTTQDIRTSSSTKKPSWTRCVATVRAI